MPEFRDPPLYPIASPILGQVVATVAYIAAGMFLWWGDIAAFMWGDSIQVGQASVSIPLGAWAVVTMFVSAAGFLAIPFLTVVAIIVVWET